MKAMTRFFRWYALQSKRLLRRPACLAVLLLIPLFALALALFARQDSGVVTVALCLQEPDRAAEAAVERLTEDGSILRCYLCDSEEQAREAVRSGQADAVWIFREGFERELARFAARGRAPAVTVVEREDNVFLRLAREKLFAALFPEASFAIFSDFVGEDLAAQLPDGTLRRYYAGETVTERILRFETLDGEEADETGSYLTAPLRGVLLVLLALCGMSSGLYAYREERDGCYIWLSARQRRFVPLLCHLTVMLPAAAAALLAMALAGVTVSAGREALLMLLYLAGAALFGELLRCLCPREEQYGALIAILSAAMLVLCPVFLELNLLRPLAMLLPPWWALRGVWSADGLLMLALYDLVLGALTALALRVRQLRRGL